MVHLKPYWVEKIPVCYSNSSYVLLISGNCFHPKYILILQTVWVQKPSPGILLIHTISWVVGSAYNSTVATTPYLYVWHHEENMKIDPSLAYPAKEEQLEQEINIYSLILAPYWCQPAGCSPMLKYRSSQIFFSSSLAAKNKVLLVLWYYKRAKSEEVTGMLT